MSRQRPEKIAKGEVLGGFRVIRTLGEGGMGTVYLAEQVRLQREVALKVLHPKLVKRNREFVGRFLREAALAAKLNHANVIQVIDAGQEEGLYFLAMEKVEGWSVHHLLKEGGALPEAVALEIARQTALALEAARAVQLIHRDIKPDNLILTREGVVKVADFGLAKNTAAASNLTRAGILMGTPAYLSPEQVQGGEADHRSDLYALGISLYEMAIGSKPFRAETVMALLMKHVMDPLPDPREVNPTLSDAFMDLLHACTAKDPARRFPTARALIQAIETQTPGQDGRKILSAFLLLRFPEDAAMERPSERLRARRLLDEAKLRIKEKDFEEAAGLLRGEGRAAGRAAPKPGDPATAPTGTLEIGGANAGVSGGAPPRRDPFEAVRRALSRSDAAGAKKALFEARRAVAGASVRDEDKALEQEVRYLEFLDKGRSFQKACKWEEGEVAFSRARALFDRKEARVGLARMRFQIWWNRSREAREAGDVKKEWKYLREAEGVLAEEGLALERSFRERFEAVEKAQTRRRDFHALVKEGKGFETAADWSRARESYRKALDLADGEGEKSALAQRLAYVGKREDRHLDDLLSRVEACASAGEMARAREVLEAYVSVRKADPAARQLQEQIAGLPDGARPRKRMSGHWTVVEWSRDGSRMVLVPAGRFPRGSGNGQQDEGPPAEVVLGGFLVDVTPVTNARYGNFLAWLEENPFPHRYCHPLEPPGKDHTPAFWNEEPWNRPGHPVVGIDWFDAWAYAHWAGKTLPTEAQWEKAARGPTPRSYPWGEASVEVSRCLCFDVGAGSTAPPSDRPKGASPYGVLDMAGNVLEWCLDYYDAAFYTRPRSRQKDPWNAEAAPRRSLRGGSWVSVAKCCRTTFRDADHPTRRNQSIGMRCVVPVVGS